MFSMSIALAAGCALLELMLVTGLAPVMGFFLRHPTGGLLFSFSGSLVLSLFFSEGLIAMVAAIMSTAIMGVVYKMHLLEGIVWWRATKDARRARIAHAKVTLVTTKNQVVTSYHEVRRTIHVLYVGICWPIVLAKKIHSGLARLFHTDKYPRPLRGRTSA